MSSAPATTTLLASNLMSTIKTANTTTSSKVISMPTSTTCQVTKQASSIWRAQLGSAFRTALACMIVGIATIYGPSHFREHITVTSFPYVVAVLVIGEATSLGEVLYGAISALCGTALAALPAMLALFLIKSQSCWIATASFSVFMVAILEPPSLIARRIAFGQIVLIYVATTNYEVIGLGTSKAIMHPANVAASSALGVVASVIAMIFPYPQLACHEVSQKGTIYKNMAIQRLRILMNAYIDENKACTSSFISQAKCLKSASAKLLQIMNDRQASIQYENPSKLLKSNWREPSRQLHLIETALQGMELALTTNTKLQPKFTDQPYKHTMINIINHLSLKLINTDYYMTGQSEVANQKLQHIFSMPQNLNDLPCIFFLFCIRLLCDDPSSVLDLRKEKKILPITELLKDLCTDEKSTNTSNTKTITKPIWALNLSREHLLVAFKFSLSIGLAAIVGLAFSREFGFWSALTVAVTVCPWRESTFKLANIRAQGAALGSVYGVLGCLISQDLMEFRFIVLLPWIIITSMLRRSQMYGSAGASAAMISGLLIVGRRDYGTPAYFTIGRLTEIFIGLACSIIVELLLQPTKASFIARDKLFQSFDTFTECLSQSLVPSKISASSTELDRKLREQMDVLKKYVGEAALEPNFWFLPFPGLSYNKIQASMTKVMELHVFMVKSMEMLVEETCGLGGANNKIMEAAIEDIEMFGKSFGSSMKDIKNVIQAKTLSSFDKQLMKKTSNDLELGNHANLSADIEQAENIVLNFLQHAKESTDRLDINVCRDLRSHSIIYLSAIGFCMGEMMKESREIERGVLELVQLENPDCYINLHQISCEFKDLAKK